MINLLNWTVRYPDGNTGVNGVTLQIPAGSRTALLGGNGAGKSTLLRSLVGLLPGEGEASVAGIRVEKGNYGAVRRAAGVVFQDPDDQLFLPTVEANVAFGPENLGVPAEEIRREVDEILKRLQIQELSGRMAARLSGGEKRLVALATVLVMKPELLLLDEPTAFLDPRARRNLISILRELPQTMLIATHDLDFASQVCPDSAVLQRGELIFRGRTEEIHEDLIF